MAAKAPYPPPKEKSSMCIRFGGKAARMALVVGAVAMAYSPIMASIALGHFVLIFGPLTMLGGIFVLGGLLQLRGATYVSVETDRFVIHALLGPLKRTFRFASREDIEYKSDRLWVTFEGRRRQLPIHRAQANPTDWLAFERWLRDGA
jgi:hypothetical protein